MTPHFCVDEKIIHQSELPLTSAQPIASLGWWEHPVPDMLRKGAVTKKKKGRGGPIGVELMNNMTAETPLPFTRPTFFLHHRPWPHSPSKWQWMHQTNVNRWHLTRAAAPFPSLSLLSYFWTYSDSLTANVEFIFLKFENHRRVSRRLSLIS